MAITLHPNCLSRLKTFLIENVPKITVQNGMFLNRSSAIFLYGIDDILPNKAGAKYEAERYIDENPLYEFALDWISRKIYEGNKFLEDRPNMKLVEIPSFSNVEEVSSMIISDFCNLPKNYMLSLILPQKLEFIYRADDSASNVYNKLRISKVDEVFKNEFPYATGDKDRDAQLHGLSLLGMWMDSAFEWKENSFCIQFEATGFVDKYGTSLTAADCISDIKSFLGLGLALDLLEYSYTFSTQPDKHKFLVHDQIGDNWRLDNAFTVESSFSEIFTNIRFNDFDGKVTATSKYHPWIYGQLNKIRSCYILYNKSHKIRLAAQWLFESYHSRNDLLSFVQNMVALEILLGDKQSSDLVGLNELLSNRCAYLIGKSQEQRTKILKDFKEIYDVRSKIVHTGKSRLSQYERILFNKLRWMCGRVISEEIKAISHTE